MVVGVSIHADIDLQQSAILPCHDYCHRVIIDFGCVFIHAVDELSL